MSKIELVGPKTGGRESKLKYRRRDISFRVEEIEGLEYILGRALNHVFRKDNWL
jgi:hypothetical protein